MWLPTLVLTHFKWDPAQFCTWPMACYKHPQIPSLVLHTLHNIYIYVCVCMYVCINIYLYIYIYAICINTYYIIYIYIQIYYIYIYNYNTKNIYICVLYTISTSLNHRYQNRYPIAIATSSPCRLDELIIHRAEPRGGALRQGGQALGQTVHAVHEDLHLFEDVLDVSDSDCFR